MYVKKLVLRIVNYIRHIKLGLSTIMKKEYNAPL